MSEQVVIDSLAFALNRETLAGTVEVSALDRLKDYLSSTEGRISYALRGDTNGLGKPLLVCEVHGTVELQCQRCLGSMPHTFDFTTSLLLVEREEQLGDPGEEDEEIDSVVADPKMDVLALVEDELLLAMPFAPRHPAGECGPAGAEEGVGTRTNPAFSVLSTLKKPR